MNLVEVLCDRIVLINRGRAVLYGPLAEIKRQYAAQTVRLRGPAALEDLPGVARVERQEEDWVLTLDRSTPQEVLRHLVERGVPLTAFEVGTMPLEEIFIAVVKEGAHA
jgi:ABC-2 type transport system ATP-binding protein